MKQQINLYQPIFRKRKEFFSAIAMLQLTIAALLLFGGFSGYSLHQLQQLEEQLATSKNNVTKMQVVVAELETERMPKTASKLLQSEVKRVSDELARRTRIVELLSKGTFANTSGFSSHFEALARQHVNGAWLTKITIEMGGAFINLQGVTHAPELVPIYLQRLLQEEVFADTSFNRMELNRSPENADEILFTVSTDSGAR